MASNELPLSMLFLALSQQSNALSLLFSSYFCIYKMYKTHSTHRAEQNIADQSNSNSQEKKAEYIVDKKLYNLSLIKIHSFKWLWNWQSLSKHTLSRTTILLSVLSNFFPEPGYGLWPKELKYQTETFMWVWECCVHFWTIAKCLLSKFRLKMMAKAKRRRQDERIKNNRKETSVCEGKNATTNTP